MRDTAKKLSPRINRHQCNANPYKPRDLAPSARVIRSERDRAWQISRDLAKEGITGQRWELDVLAGGTVRFDGKHSSYLVTDEQAK